MTRPKNNLPWALLLVVLVVVLVTAVGSWLRLTYLDEICKNTLMAWSRDCIAYKIGKENEEREEVRTNSDQGDPGPDPAGAS